MNDNHFLDPREPIEFSCFDDFGNDGWGNDPDWAGMGEGDGEILENDENDENPERG